MGLMSDDGNFAAVPPMLAELLGMPHATARGAGRAQETARVTVERELEGGALEVVELTAPCLLAVQTGINQVRYASLKGIMAAKKKPLDVKTVADLGLAGQVGAGAAKMQDREDLAAAEGRGRRDPDRLDRRDRRRSSSARSRSSGCSSARLEGDIRWAPSSSSQRSRRARSARPATSWPRFAHKIGAAAGRQVKSLVMGRASPALAEEFAKKGGGEVVYVADDAALANYSVDAALARDPRGGRRRRRRARPDLEHAERLGRGAAHRGGARRGLRERLLQRRRRGRQAGLPAPRVQRQARRARARRRRDRVVATVQPGATAPFAGRDRGKVDGARGRISAPRAREVRRDRRSPSRRASTSPRPTSSSRAAAASARRRSSPR